MRFSLLIVFFIVILYSCSSDNMLEHRACDAETISKDINNFLSIDKKYEFDGVKNRSAETAFSGKYSLKLDINNPYGFTTILNDSKPDEYIEISSMVKSESKNMCIVVSCDNAKDFYVSINTVDSIFSDGWKKIVGNVFIPPHLKDKKISIYAYNPDSIPAYFDDIEIVRYKNKKYPNYSKDDALCINISKSNYNKLKEKQINAFKEGIIEKSDDDWVEAEMNSGKKKYKVKLRLKGDWLDHLNGDKWSFRIKIKNNKSYDGMIEFSIQSPHTRFFLKEWAAHKLFQEEGLLATKYKLVPVYLNDKSLGIYAVEEHFEKQLIESNSRREGPILKFSENGLWYIQNLMNKENVSYNLPVFLASEILPFGINKIGNSNSLKNQFIIAQNLLLTLKNSKFKTSEIFDVEKLAKYFALLDLTKSYHGLVWHNMRFYYNPVISRLEPILFDCYTTDGVFNRYGRSIFGFIDSLNNNSNDEQIDESKVMLEQLFTDSVFEKKYIYYLRKYSSNEYVNTFLENNNKKIRYKESLINKEYKFYKYESDFLSKNSKIIREELPVYLDYSQNNCIKHLDSIINENRAYNSFSNVNSAIFFVNAYIESETKDSIYVRIFNYFPQDVYLYTKNNNKIHVKPFSNGIPKYYDLVFQKRVTTFKFSVGNNKEKITKKINQWPYPNKFIPRIELEKSFDINKNDYFEVKGSEVRLKKSITTISKSVVIPTGYKLVLSKGQKIDLIKKSVFISYSPVEIIGTKEEPVIIKSSDNTANGFTILQAGDKSILNYAIFDGLNTLDYKGWTLTGAVNFYESDVDITNCSFLNNVSEDGLNIIRSEFIVRDSKFENTFSDAFDSDFSNGKVIDCIFNNLHNDAIDFSGSNVEVVGCKISNAKDKAVSGGEKSKMTIKNLEIIDCNIGIASKDKSKLEVENVSISNCNYGFVLLQKKPEFGDAKINAKNIKLNNNKTPYLIEKGSEFILEGKEIKGTEKKLAKQFYQ